MHYGNIKPFSIENGPGVRVSLFVSGCRNHCPGCFSAHTWDFAYGKEFDEAAQAQLLEELRPDYIQGLTVLGGEPMEPENQRDLLSLLRRIRSELPGKDIWIYTGFTLTAEKGRFTLTDLGACENQELRERADISELQEILTLTDVLVDGRFHEEEKDLLLAFRGSRNQRIIDLQASLQSGQIRLCEKWMSGTRMKNGERS